MTRDGSPPRVSQSTPGGASLPSNPELLIDEKRALLEDLREREGRVVFTHDPEVAIARVARDERGRFHAVADGAQ